MFEIWATNTHMLFKIGTRTHFTNSKLFRKKMHTHNKQTEIKTTKKLLKTKWFLTIMLLLQLMRLQILVMVWLCFFCCANENQMCKNFDFFKTILLWWLINCENYNFFLKSKKKLIIIHTLARHNITIRIETNNSMSEQIERPKTKHNRCCRCYCCHTLKCSLCKCVMSSILMCALSVCVCISMSVCASIVSYV